MRALPGEQSVTGGRSENRKRTIALAGRFTPEEAALVRAKAASCGGVSALIRHTTIDEPLPRLATGGETLARLLTEFGKLRGELGKHGSNLNQLTHYANMDRLLAGSVAAALEDFERSIRTLDELRLVTLQAMGRERNRKPPKA
jgi:hypothetical protein